MKEFWDGKVFTESPLFADYSVVNPQSQQRYYLGQSVEVHVNGSDALGKIVGVFEVDKVAKASVMLYERVAPGEDSNCQEVQLQWDSTVEVDPSCITKECSVYAADKISPLDRRSYPFVCTGANSNGKFYPYSDLPTLLMDIVPKSTLAKILAAEKNQELFIKHFIVYFYDDFAALSKVAHKTGAGYVTSGNLSRADRHDLGNIRIVHVVPPSVDPKEVLRSFAKEVSTIEQCEVVMTVPHASATGDRSSKQGVVACRCGGGIGVVPTDMPQGNDFAQVKRPTAICGCRRCLIQKPYLSTSQDSPLLSNRTLKKTERITAAIDQATTGKAKEGLSKRYGIRGPLSESAIYGVVLDLQRQLPHDPFHCDIIGNTAALLATFLGSLTELARKELSNRMSMFDPPSNWPSIPELKLNSKLNKLKNGAQKVKEAMQVIHLVCCGWLTKGHFRDIWATGLLAKNGGNFVERVLDTLALQAKSNSVVFAEENSRSPEDNQELQELLRQNRAAFVAVWDGVLGVKANKPNRHVTEHHPETQTDFGTLGNASTARFETKHAILRLAAAHSNYNLLEVCMCESENVYEAIMFVARGGAPDCLAPGVAEWLSKDEAFQWALSQWACGATSYAGDLINEDSAHRLDEKVEPAGATGTGTSLSVYSIQTSVQFLKSNMTAQQLGKHRLPVLAQPVHRNSTSSLFTSHVKELRLNRRETYRRKVMVGCWYKLEPLLSPNFVAVRVLDCFYFKEGPTGETHYWVAVQPFASIGTYSKHYSVLEKEGFPLKIPVSLIVRPAHVTHLCKESCTAQSTSNGNKIAHDESNGTYIYNPFYLK